MKQITVQWNGMEHDGKDRMGWDGVGQEGLEWNKTAEQDRMEQNRKECITCFKV